MKLTAAERVSYDPLSWMHISYTGQKAIQEKGVIRSILNRAINQKYAFLPVSDDVLKDTWGQYICKNWQYLPDVCRCMAAYLYRGAILRKLPSDKLASVERDFMNSSLRYPVMYKGDSGCIDDIELLSRAVALDLCKHLPVVLAQRVPYLFKPGCITFKSVPLPDLLLLRLAIQHVRNYPFSARPQGH